MQDVKLQHACGGINCPVNSLEFRVGQLSGNAGWEQSWRLCGF